MKLDIQWIGFFQTKTRIDKLAQNFNASRSKISNQLQKLSPHLLSFTFYSNLIIVRPCAVLDFLFHNWSSKRNITIIMLTFHVGWWRLKSHVIIFAEFLFPQRIIEYMASIFIICCSFYFTLLFLKFLCFFGQTINVYNQAYESAAAFWPDVHRRIITGMIISHLLLIGLMSTKEASQSTPLLIPLPILTIWFHRFCKSRFESAFIKFPLQVSCYFFI